MATTADRATVTTRRRRDRGRNRTRRRLAAQARPHYLMAATASVGAAGAGLGSLVPDSGTAGLGVAMAGAAAAGIAAVARRATARQAAVGLGAAGWVGWVTAAGLSWPAMAALAVGGYGASLRHWRRHRLPDPPEWTPPAEVDELSPPRLWDRHIAGSGGPLVDTRLSGETALRTGVRYDLELVPGRHALTDVRTALPKLRTGLRLRPGQDLVVEQHPTADEATVLLTIVRQSTVLTRPQPWPGNTYAAAAGTIALGPYIDGEGTAVWLLHADQRLWSGFLTGATGSGKSRLMEGVALGAAAAGCVVWFLDPQAGASSPFLADHCDWTGRGVDQVRDMLEAARAVKDLRQAQNALHGWEGWTPEQGRPGLLLVVDECHRVFEDPRCQAVATELAREGGKCGVAMVTASQVATLDVWGGGGQADALRSSVTAGNTVLLRTKSNNTKSVMNAGGVDPTTFPRVPGYAYLLDDTGTRRSAPLRGYYLDDATRDRAAAQVTWPELDPASAAAGGGPYACRREQAAADRDALMARIATLTGGRPVSAPISPAPAGLPGVPQFPAPPAVQPVATTAVDAVAAALAGGATRPAELEAVTGYGETSVRQALRELTETGRARRTGYGRYELTTTVASVATN